MKNKGLQFHLHKEMSVEELQFKHLLKHSLKFNPDFLLVKLVMLKSNLRQENPNIGEEPLMWILTNHILRKWICLM